MAYDPTKPANGTQIAAPELRAQFLGLFNEIQQHPTQADLANQIATTSNNSNSVNTFNSQGTSWSDGEKQQIADKIDELINALRR